MNWQTARGVVTSTSPLRVRFEGDDGGSPGTPIDRTLVAVSEDDEVRCVQPSSSRPGGGGWEIWGVYQ